MLTGWRQTKVNFLFYIETKNNNTIISVVGLGIKEEGIIVNGEHSQNRVEKFLQKVAEEGDFCQIKERLWGEFGNPDGSKQEDLPLPGADAIDTMTKTGANMQTI
jgi:hypothetical protein